MPKKSLMFTSAKTVFRLALNAWIANPNIISDATADIAEIVKTLVDDDDEQEEVHHLLDDIQLKVRKNLSTIFDKECGSCEEEIKHSIARSVEATLHNVTSEMLVNCDLNTLKLSHSILEQYPASRYLLFDVEEELYKRMIYISCRYVVDLSSMFPQFSRDAFAKLLERQTDISKSLDQLLQSTQRMYEDLHSQIDNYERIYVSAVEDKFNILELLGTGKMKLLGRTQNLIDAYVTLQVNREKQDIMGNTYRSGYAQGATYQNVISINEALAYSRRLLICGDAGSGKTTLLQWIAVRAAQKSFPQILRDWNKLIPFYIRLRKYVKSNEQGTQIHIPTLEEFPCFDDYIEKADSNWIQNLLLKGHALVLIDGIDEVPEIHRLSVRNWLKHLVKSYKNSYFVVTSRSYAVNKEEGDWTRWINTLEFDVATLQPTSWPDDIKLFIDQWYMAVEKQELDKAKQASLPLLAERLKQELQSERSKRELAKSPLLCAMLCALKREGEGEGEQNLPSNRIDLYQACCRLLIESREKARNIPNKDYPAADLHYDQKFALLRDVAYWMMLNGLTVAIRKDIDGKFQAKLKELTRLPSIMTNPDGSGEVREDGGSKAREFFVERSSIIREPVMAQIDFTHRTFQEFLAVKEVIKRQDMKFLIGHAYSDRWREVVLLVAQSLDEKKDWEAFITGLLDEGDIQKNYSPVFYLLAAACLNAGTVDSAIKERVSTRMSRLLPLRSIQHVEALKIAGALAIPYLSNNIQHHPDVKAACVRALATICSEESLEESLQALEGFIEDSSERVSYELWSAWRNFEGKEKTRYEDRVLSKLSACPGSKYSLSIENLSSLHSFQQFTQLGSLHLSNCQGIVDITPLTSLTQLESLVLNDCPQIYDITPIESLTRLKNLSLSNCNQLSSGEPLKALFQLSSLYLQGCFRLYNISFLEELTELTSLSLIRCSHSTNFSVLNQSQMLSNLVSRQLSDCSSLYSARVLQTLWSLTSLNLSWCQNLDDISHLKSLVRLRSLDLSNCSSLHELSAISSLHLLETLDLSGCKLLHYLPTFTQHSALKVLDLSRCPLLDNLEPLSSLSHLTQLNLTECPKVTDIRPLTSLPNLKEVYLTPEEFKRMRKPMRRNYKFEIKLPPHR